MVWYKRVYPGLAALGTAGTIPEPREEGNKVQKESPILTLAREGLEAKISPAGGRILSVSLEGREVLETAARQTGSTFWTSPQADWEWPPVPAHDSAPYRVVSRDPLVLEGSPDARLGLSVTKTFDMPAPGVFRQTFRIANHGTAPRRAAPWQISRVPPGGTDFFAPASGSRVTGSLVLEAELGFLWLRHKGQDQQKAFARSEGGWLAHEGCDTVLLKVFPPVAPGCEAPGEAEVELYGAYDYVETEAQGPMAILAPGETTDWTMLWQVFAREDLPADPGAMARKVRDHARELARLLP